MRRKAKRKGELNRLQQMQNTIRRMILAQILEEIKKLNQFRETTDAQMKELKQSNESMKKTLAQQQRFLEGLDADKRATNVIAVGVPEDALTFEGTTAENDEAMSQMILQAIDCADIRVTAVNRLGKKGNAARPRPIKITLEQASQRPHLLEKAKNLAGGPLKEIRLKKDVHPAIRREYARLHEVEKSEREKPENAGLEVRYDPRQRTVLVDGQAVDSFMPSFF